MAREALGVLRPVVHAIHAERLKHFTASGRDGDPAVERPDAGNRTHTLEF